MAWSRFSKSVMRAVSILLGCLYDPDISEPDGVAVVLQVKGAGVGPFFDGGCRGAVGQFGVVLHDYAVQAGGEARIFYLFALCIVFCSRELGVVGLPDQGGEAHIHRRIFNAVNTSGFIVFAKESEGVEHLRFVTALVIDAAVAAALSARARHVRSHELDMETVAAKLLNAGGAFHQQTVLRHASALKLISAGAVEEDDRAGRRFFSERGALPLGANEGSLARCVAREDDGGFGVLEGDGESVVFEHGGSVPSCALNFASRRGNAASAREASVKENGFEGTVSEGDDLQTSGVSVEASGVFTLDQIVGAGFCRGGCYDGLVCWVGGTGGDRDKRCWEEMDGFHAVENSKTLSRVRM